MQNPQEEIEALRAKCALLSASLTKAERELDARPQKPSSVSAPQTQSVPFLACNDEMQKLFTVQPGIPWEDARNQLEILLSITYDLLFESNGNHTVTGGHIAAGYIVEMAGAIVKALEGGEK